MITKLARDLSIKPGPGTLYKSIMFIMLTLDTPLIFPFDKSLMVAIIPITATTKRVVACDVP